MSFKEYVKKLVKDYFVIFAVIVIGVTLLQQLLAPKEFYYVNDIYTYMFAALLGDLPSLIFYSKKEISEKQMIFRIIIHFIVLEVVLITFAVAINLVTGIAQALSFALDIAILYFIIRLLIWNDDRNSTKEINKKLKSINSLQTNEQER